MNAISEAVTALRDAVATVEGVRVYTDPGASVDPPGVIVGSPRLTWGTGCSEPTTAQLLVYVIVAVSDRASERLWELVPLVAAALDALPAAVVIRADPGAYRVGNVDLPSYEITTEVSLA